MTKLKALRGAIGTYGRVSAGGIIDVDESKVAALLKTKRFTRADEQDIEAAQLAQKRALSATTPGAGPGFMPMPKKPEKADRLAQLIERGEISREKAKELAAIEISLSTEEVQAFIKKEADEIAAQFDAVREELDARAQELDQREHDLAEREKALGDDAGSAKTETESKAKKDVQAEPESASEATTTDSSAKPDTGAPPKTAKSSK